MKGMKQFRILAVASLLTLSSLSTVLADEDSTRDEETRDDTIVEFDDTKNLDWAKDHIGRMKVKGIFQGYEDGTFKPNEPVTRIQSIITAVRLLGLEDEAKTISLDPKLQFKDAEIFEKDPSLKGYILVALKNGLFDPSEETIQPYKPAERVWISTLLVRALGLEQEALRAMTDIPDFKDTKQIPAGAIGYVNMATEYGIFSGTEAGLFQPNDPITRAQMAAVLDRTYGELLEENGARTVTGVVKAVSFNNNSDTGEITVETRAGQVLRYEISEDRVVQFSNRFMSADQILVGDNIELYVEDNEVIEAAIFKKTEDKEVSTGIQELKVEIEFEDDQSFELKYQSHKGKIKAEIETNESEEKVKGNEALALIEKYLASWDLATDMSEEEITSIILSSFERESDSIGEFQFKVKFANGEKINIESGNDDRKPDDDNTCVDDRHGDDSKPDDDNKCVGDDKQDDDSKSDDDNTCVDDRHGDKSKPDDDNKCVDDSKHGDDDKQDDDSKHGDDDKQDDDSKHDDDDDKQDDDSKHDDDSKRDDDTK